MDVPMTDLPTEQAIAELERNLWGMWRQFGLGPECRLVDEPDLMRFETPLRQVPYNAVMRFRPDDVSDRHVDDTIDATIDVYRQRQVPMVWVVHPTRRPHD